METAHSAVDPYNDPLSPNAIEDIWETNGDKKRDSPKGSARNLFQSLGGTEG